MKELRQIFSFIAKHPLAGRHRWRAFFRFFGWQLSHLFYVHERSVPFVGDTRLLATKGLTGLTGNIYTGLEDFSDMGFLLHFLRKEDLFADIGANAGSYSVLAGGCTGARTICFEPVPASFSWLVKNIEANGLGQLVHPRNIGLGSKRTELLFTSSNGTVNHVVAAHEETGKSDVVSVPVFPFDEIASVEGVPRLMKIDVEGFETEVLKGMEKSLQSDELKAIIIELNGSGWRYGYDESRIHQQLTDLQFYPCTYHPFTRIVERLEGFGSHNTIYIRDLAFVEERVKKAEKFRVFSESI